MTSKPPKKFGKSTDRSPSEDFIVEGLAAVAEYIRFRPDALVDVASTREQRKHIESLLNGAGVAIPVRELSPARDNPTFAAPVQGRIKLRTIDEQVLSTRIIGRSRDLIIALDHITDPRNLGAIARTAAFFGVREIVAPERRQVLLTQASVATAQGGFALTDLAVVTNLARFLESLKEKGYWVVGTAMDGEPINRVAGVYEKMVLVLGNEESGLSQLVRQRCDRTVCIKGRPAVGQSKILDSLNVSVATGIFLHAFTQPGTSV